MAHYKTFKKSVAKRLRNARNTFFFNLIIGVEIDIKKTWYLNNGFLKPNQRKKNIFIKPLIRDDIENKAKQDISEKLNLFFLHQ